VSPLGLPDCQKEKLLSNFRREVDIAWWPRPDKEGAGGAMPRGGTFGEKKE